MRAQLTWCSPHATLFMFTSVGGARPSHSMSRRTLDQLRGNDHLRVVADRPVVDEALDQVAQAALKNSLGHPGATASRPRPRPVPNIRGIIPVSPGTPWPSTSSP